MSLSFGDAMSYLCIQVYVYETILVIACLIALHKWHRSICELYQREDTESLQSSQPG